MEKRALFAVSTLWLWHATRTLPIIKFYLDKWYKLDIVCFWKALNYLKNELKDFEINFIEYSDYPALERWNWVFFYPILAFDIFTTYIKIKKENLFLKKLEEKNNYNFIFSDWKYWFYSKNTKSYLLTHQLSFDIPKYFEFSQDFMDSFNKRYFKKFTKIFIPDYKDKEKNLAWKLSHPSRLKNINHSFVGILSSLSSNLNSTKEEEKNLKNEKIDFLFTISWYLDEHKNSFIKKLQKEAKKLPWKKVFILWDTSKEQYSFDEKNNIETYSFLAWEKKNKVFKNAEIIISRAWYTTIMDLVELEKKAILFPTPNQTEQIYLAKYLWEKKYFIYWENNQKLNYLIEKISEIKKFENSQKTIKTLEKIFNEIN